MDSGSNPQKTELVRELPLALLDPNPWNPNRMAPANYARLRRELARGFLAPLLVRPAGDRFQVVDGEHRFRLAGDLGRATVPCVVAEMSDEEARIKTLQMNGLRGENDPDLLGRLLAELRARLPPERLAAVLPWSADEIEAMAALSVARAQAEVRRIGAGLTMPVAREIYAVVLPAGGRAEVEAAVAAARARERAPDDGAALLAICQDYRGK